MEHRKNIRYPLGARVVFSWEGPKQNRLQGEGQTRDVSLAGAFIFSLTCPPVGTTARLDLFLPPLSGTVPVARIKGEARVVRIEHIATREEQSGFAVASEGFWFLKGRDSEP